MKILRNALETFLTEIKLFSIYLLELGRICKTTSSILNHLLWNKLNLCEGKWLYQGHLVLLTFISKLKCSDVSGHPGSQLCSQLWVFLLRSILPHAYQNGWIPYEKYTLNSTPHFLSMCYFSGRIYHHLFLYNFYWSLSATGNIVTLKNLIKKILKRFKNYKDLITSISTLQASL